MNKATINAFSYTCALSLISIVCITVVTVMPINIMTGNQPVHLITQENIQKVNVKTKVPYITQNHIHPSILLPEVRLQWQRAKYKDVLLLRNTS